MTSEGAHHHAKIRTVAVYTMGKVGSSSVTAALEQAGCQTLQVHVLAGGTKQLRRRLDRRPNVRHLQSSVRVSELIDQNQPFKIVSLVRDPVSRNVSAFFQNFHRLVGGNIENLDVKEVRRLICEHVLPDEPQQWLDAELIKFAGVDLPRHRLYEGPQVAAEARWPTLLLRSDYNDEVKSDSMCDFLESSNVMVKRSSNVTAEKMGASLNAEIKQLGMPRNYVDECLAQPFVSSTWSPDEIEKLRERWYEKATPAGGS